MLILAHHLYSITYSVKTYMNFHRWEAVPSLVISPFPLCPSPNSSATPPSCQSPEPPMTPGEFDMLSEQLCFDIDTVSLHALSFGGLYQFCF